MDQVFACSCGIKTRNPYYINGAVLCVMCADRVAPRLVSHRVSADWRTFTTDGRRVPTTPGYRARWQDHDVAD